MQPMVTINRPPDFTVPESKNFGWNLLARLQSRERNFSIAVQRFEPGGSFVEHEHDLDQFFYVTGGRFEMTIDGQKRTCVKGDLVFVDRNQKHAGRNLDEGFSELLVIDSWPSDSTSTLGLEEASG